MAKKTSENRQNLDSKVRDGLRAQILSGVLPNGTHLSEIKISEQFGVSRTPVREALCALAADGLIDMIPNRGCFVRTPSDETRLELADMYATLLAMGARLATLRLTDADLAKLDTLVASLTPTNPAEFDTGRTRIHDMLRQAAASRVLDDLLTTIERRMAAPYITPPADGRRRAEVQQAYGFLMAALKRRKADLAEKNLRDLLAPAPAAALAVAVA